MRPVPEDPESQNPRSEQGVTTALMERLDRIAHKSFEDEVEKGCTIEFLVCRTCGFAEWTCSSRPGEGFKVEAVMRTKFDGPCERCRVAFTRAPEVFEWVMGVFNHQLHESSDSSKEGK